MSRPRTGSVASYITENERDAPAILPPLERQRLGPYRLCMELASGGMASVYLARTEGHTAVSRFVALKRVHPHLATDAGFVEMFLDEARIASLVQHPNVCSVLDFDCVDGQYYLAMEFLVGETLASVFRAMVHRPSDDTRAPSRASLVARVVADACEGLHAAHELRDPSGNPLRVVHRDVSPENLFLTYTGVVKVVDFGVARASSQRHLTVPGMIKGKLAYMPPEVLRGVSPDRRADVWAIGVVLWELLTGTRLFHRGTDIETLATIAEVRIPPPSTVASDVPADFDDIVLKALASDPDARYQTARDLAKDLTLALARRGDAVGLAELSEWMDELFPAGAACKRHLLEMAASVSSDGDDLGAAPLDPSEERPTTVRAPLHEEFPPPARAATPRPSAILRGLAFQEDSPHAARKTDPPLRLRVPETVVPLWRRSAATFGIAAVLCAAPAFLLLARSRDQPAEPVLPPTPAPPSKAVEDTGAVLKNVPVTHPVPRESSVLTFGPGSYAVDVEPSPDGDPGAIVLRLRPLAQQMPQTARTE